MEQKVLNRSRAKRHINPLLFRQAHWVLGRSTRKVDHLYVTDVD